MSLAFDENGRPFIILREQEKKKRTKGLEAHKVSLLSLLSILTLYSDQHYGSSHCSKPAQDIPRSQRYGQDARQVSAFVSSTLLAPTAKLS